MNGEQRRLKNPHLRNPSWTAKAESAAVAADSQALSTMAWNRCPPWLEYANKDTDKVAGYGLAALVGGLAMKKLGLLGTLGLLLAKFGKLILIGLAALGGIIVKFFKHGGQPA